MSNDGRKNVSLHQRLVEEFTRRLVGGAWRPGTLLPPEARLAEEFGVSRIVVRETVKVLVEKGMLTVRQGRGTTVQPESLWNPLDPLILRFRQQAGATDQILSELVEARYVFEVQAVGLSAVRVSDDELRRIDLHLRRMDTLTGSPDEFYIADTEFHLMVVRAAQNRVLAKLIEPIRDLLRNTMRETVRIPNAAQSAQVHHWRIFRALQAHDRRAAEDAMRAHLDQAALDAAALGRAPAPGEAPSPVPAG